MSKEAQISRRRIRLRIATIGFPVALWFAATFFLLGDLGRLNDDWFYIQRVPETGAVRSLVLDHPIHFWRPLYRVVVPALATLLWQHQWANHLILVLVHGLNGWLLWRVLTALRVRRMAAAISALGFLVAPWHFEVVFWLCNLPTSLSTATMLGSMLVAITWARSRAGWWIVAFAAVATFASASLNEQPTMMIGTLPLVALCAVRGPGVRRVLARSVVAAGAGAVTMAFYTLLHMKMVGPRLDIGDAHGILPLSRWPASAGQALSWLRDFIVSIDWSMRAWYCAGVVVVEFPIRTAIAGCGVLAGGVMWVREMGRHGHEQIKADSKYPARPLYLGLLGLAVIVLTSVPVVAFQYWTMPRMVYAPAIGAAMLLASLFSGAAAWSRKPLETLVRSRVVIASVAVAAFIAQAIAMAGVQEGYRRRDRLDRASLEELVIQAPEPRAGSVFVPAFVEFPDIPPSAGRFEWYYWSVFGSWWSSEFAIRLTYRRSDLCAGNAAWGRSGWSEPSTDTVAVRNVGRVPWARVIAFTLDARGHVRPVTQVRFVENGQAREIDLPQAKEFVEKEAAASNTYTFPARKP